MGFKHGCVQERLRVSIQLEEEMQVQAAAIEAARGNVEHHYNYICSHFQDFMTKCAPSCQPHMLYGRSRQTKNHLSARA